MSRVLVVGANSPLGVAISGALAAAGHEVHGASRTGAAGSDAVDITDPQSAVALLRRARPEAVVYLARPDLTVTAADIAAASAVHAVRRFAEHCHAEGVERFLFASSAAVYGTSSAEARAEDDATPAVGPYAQMKLRSEETLAEAAETLGLTTVTFRIFNVYGPGFRSSLVNRLLDAAHGAPPPTVFATNDYVRDYVHADDVAAAFAAAVAVQDLASSVLNVGTGIGTGNLELLSLATASPWLPAGGLAAPSISVAAVERLAGVLGVTPRRQLATAFQTP